jgi:hypothetical protein
MCFPNNSRQLQTLSSFSWRNKRVYGGSTAAMSPTICKKSVSNNNLISVNSTVIRFYELKAQCVLFLLPSNCASEYATRNVKKVKGHHIKHRITTAELWLRIRS